MAKTSHFKVFIKKNFLLLFCALVIFLQFSQIIYLKRAEFFQKYDVSYWKDRFEHSQYVMPISQRTIGDDALYNYAGYRLIKGESIENTTTFKPPVGLYLLGLSILVLNPLLIEILLGIGIVILLFLLSNELLKDKNSALMITTLFALEPFFYNNLTIGLLDLPQLFFLLLHFVFLMWITKNKKYSLLFSLLSGISLGLFTETKPPILLPLIIILEAFYFYKQKMLLKVFPFSIGFILGAVLPYFRYFQEGNNLISYFKFHKYMASIYSSGYHTLYPMSTWQSLFLGYFPDVVTGKLGRINEWMIMLPIVSILGVFSMVKIFFKKNTPLFIKIISLFSFGTLIIYTLIPSYPRYLLLVIPFFFIFTGLFIKRFLSSNIFQVSFIVVTVFAFLYSTYFNLPSVNNTLNNFKYDFSHKYFQDIYKETLSEKDQKKYSFEQFKEIGQKALIDANIKEVRFKEISRDVPMLEKSGSINLKMTYFTYNLGSFTEIKKLNLVRENGAWKIKWNWNLIENSFKPGYSFKTDITFGKRGKILDSKGNTLAEDREGFLISINPSLIDTKKEKEMLKAINETSPYGVYFQNAYLENPLINSYIPVTTTFVDLNPMQLTKLKSFPGVQLTPYMSRIYNGLSPLEISNTYFSEHDTTIYSSSDYHGVTGVEKLYDGILSGQDGGVLQLVDNKGNLIKTLISRDAKNGKDVILPN